MILEAVEFGAGVAAMVALHAKLLRKQADFHAARVKAWDEAEEGRRVAAYKMAKANERVVARSDKAVRQMADQARGLHEDARLLHERVDGHFAHPNVKRLVNEE